VEKPAKQLLARQGYDPQFGARPLKRTIQELLLYPLAQRILSGAYKPGDHIRVTAQGNEIIFEK
jgi:ATP-dependent Clp protease ATP-binding subunit ClpA